MAIRDDLIRRRDALESVAGLADTMSVCVSTDECRGMMRMKMCALSAINEVPAAAPRGEEADGERERAWVSVKDALPENHMERRLTQKNFDICADYCACSKDCGFFKHEVNVMCNDAEIYNKLRAYEDAEEAGLLVWLPCERGNKTVTWQQVLDDFEKRYPEYFKHFVDYRPTDKPFVIQIWLDVANAVTGNNTITYLLRTGFIWSARTAIPSVSTDCRA